MAEVVISEFMDEAIAREVLADFELLYEPTLVDDRDALLDHLSNARAIIVRNRTQVDRELLDAAASLVAVGRLGVGLDNIDLAACKKRKIEVLPATGANDLAVAEYAITAALMLMRGAWLSTPRLIAGEWPRTELMGREISGKRLGLIGFGSIAQHVAARAKALGMQVCASDPYLQATAPAWKKAESVPLGTLAETSDVISVHVPLTESTRHMVDAKLIARMQKGVVLVNSARGGVVDEAALVDALRSGQLGGAALDVFEHEPLDAESGVRFADIPNLVLTPHIAGITEESNERVSRVTAENVARQLKG